MGSDQLDVSSSEDALGKLFGSTSRARILRLLCVNPDREFYQREIMYETGLSLQPVQRELGILLELGVLIRLAARNRIYYRVDTDSVWFKPLRDLMGSGSAAAASADKPRPGSRRR